MTSFEKVITSLITFLAQTPGREKLCRLLQYYGKYLSSVYQLQLDANPHLYNELTLKMKKADTVWASMAIARKILRFGPSIVMVKTFILNTIELINRQNKESTPIFILKTLSALWIAMFFICDHYLWLYRMGSVKNEAIKTQCDYYSVLGWWLDCWTGVLKNILIYLQLSEKERKKQQIPLAIDCIRLILDMPVAYSFLKAGSVSGKVVGACGTITSLIGMYQMWK